MQIIVDTNIVFSAILNTNGKIGDLLLNSTEIFDFYSVTYLRLELENNKDKLVNISKLSNSQIEESKSLIFSRINFISEAIIPFEYWKSSIDLVKDIDMDDIAFVALSKYMGNLKLWTGDKKLYFGLKAKGFKQIINTTELEQLRLEIEDDKK